MRLVAWARAVKARRRRRPSGAGGAGGAPPPVLWLFTDAERLPDPRAAAARLPRGLCGVVLRHDGAPGRAALARDLARICRARRNALVVAGDARLARAVGAGVHARGGRRSTLPGPGGVAVRRRGRWDTSSAHSVAELVRAGRSGASIAFVSPVFPTASHPGAGALGTVRAAALAERSRRLGLLAMALGGVDGERARGLPRSIGGAGAIGALT